MSSFDIVVLECPHCGTPNHLQSKGGDCKQRTYQWRRVPIGTANALDGDIVECTNCHKSVKIEVHERHVSMSLEPIKNESEDHE